MISPRPASPPHAGCASDLFPLLSADSRLPKNPGEQCHAYVAAVWIGDSHGHIVADHELVLPA